MTHQSNTTTHSSINNRDDLLEVFSNVQGQYNTTLHSIAQREKSISGKMKKLKNCIDKDPWAKSSLRQGHEFQAKTTQHLEKINSLLKTWVENAESYDKRTEFRSKFNDSLLIFVFGKVKAGKSSLGNFMAYGYSEPTQTTIEEASPVPKFFWKTGNNSTETMSDGSMQEKRCFGVGTAETTSSIQGFTLPGITWVDSPGVHSRRAENEQLTKDYAAAADVIVFLSNSSEPGRRSDIEEIKDLIGQDKPLLVIITASDYLETDVNDDGQIVQNLCMKSAQDRQGQIDFVSQEIQSFGNKTQVLAISMKYAENHKSAETVTQALHRWKDSGMQDVANALAAISVSQGVATKRTTPLKNLKNYCEVLLGVANEESHTSMEGLSSIHALETDLKKIKAMLQTQREDIRQECSDVLPKIRSALRRKINMLVQKHAMDDGAFKEACMDAFKSIRKKYELEVGEQFIDSFKNFDLNALREEPNFPDFKERFETRTYTSKTAENVGAAVGTAGGGWAGAAGGAALGSMVPVVGTLIGGLLGAALGGFFGGKAGSATGENFNSEEKFQTKVGDNSDEVAAESIKILAQTSELYMNEIVNELDKLCFESLEKWIKEIEISLHDFRKTLQKQINEIKSELVNETA